LITVAQLADTPHKRVVQAYLDGFGRGDHAAILAQLADDVTWLIPGFFEVRGKDAFEGEIENEAFEGPPKISAHRLIEEGDVVVAIGAVESPRKDGGTLHAAFCDVFTFTGDKIARLESYLMPTEPAPPAQD
jgi:ketosteroid isomerase-like protein